VIAEPSARHPRWVRISHGITAVALLLLVFSGVEILMVHPRLYWGNAGNDLTPALLELPISRNYKHGGWNGEARTYDIFNQNGWGRSLHFLAAWALVVTGIVYVAFGVADRHFRWHNYGSSQRGAYLIVVFGLAPLIAATGLTMSPAVTAAVPALLRVFGGYQSARTLHFAAFVALTLFVAGHVAMVARSGFARQVRGIVAGE